MAQQWRSRGERRRTVAPVLEGLEDRRMLSAYTGPSIGAPSDQLGAYSESRSSVRGCSKFIQEAGRVPST